MENCSTDVYHEKILHDEIILGEICSVNRLVDQISVSYNLFHGKSAALTS